MTVGNLSHCDAMALAERLRLSEQQQLEVRARLGEIRARAVGASRDLLPPGRAHDIENPNDNELLANAIMPMADVAALLDSMDRAE